MEEMNEGLIDNWNNIVKPQDTIFVLGDFLFGGTGKIAPLVPRLNGRKCLIIGNHDRKYKPHRWIEFGFESAYYSANFEDIFSLSHFPWKGHEHDERTFSWQLERRANHILLHGHVHKGWKLHKGMLNVGVDVWDYKPVSLEEINQYLKDHHF